MSAFDHDEIYLQPVCCVNEDIGRLWCEDADPEDCEDGKHWTRYVRSDIHESTIAQLEALRQERDGLRDLIIKTMNSYIREMEGYSYFGSNPGIDDDDIEEIADEIIAAMAKEQGDGN